MNIYGRAAIRATNLFTETGCPKKAWKIAIEEYTDSPSSRSKPCPRSAYLGLCQEGLVRGVPAGAYTTSPKNARYTVYVACLLQKEPSLANKPPDKLWNTAMTHIGRRALHQGQMDVLLALWYVNMIPRSRKHPRPPVLLTL